MEKGEGVTTNLVDVVLAVFTAIGNWFVTAIQSLLAVFYADGALTFLGVLCVVGVGIAIILMVLRIIGSFLNLNRAA